jgi:hypothetical protein
LVRLIKPVADLGAAVRPVDLAKVDDADDAPLGDDRSPQATPLGLLDTCALDVVERLPGCLLPRPPQPPGQLRAVTLDQRVQLICVRLLQRT